MGNFALRREAVFLFAPEFIRGNVGVGCGVFR